MIKMHLVSQNENDNLLVQGKLESLKKEFGAMDFSTSRPASLASNLDINSSMVIYNCTSFSSSLIDFSQNLREINYLGPVLILVKIPDVKVLEDFKPMKNTVLVEKPYTRKDLLGIARKFLKDAQVNQRSHRRFETDQSALLESYQRDFVVQSKIENISRGGVFIRGPLEDLSRGDLLRVNFNLDELNKTHTMSAKVVWTDGNVDESERTAGLQFMTKEDIYSQLLNTL